MSGRPRCVWSDLADLLWHSRILDSLLLMLRQCISFVSCLEQSCRESCCLRAVTGPGLEEKVPGRMWHWGWLLRDRWGLLGKVRAVRTAKGRQLLQRGVQLMLETGGEWGHGLCDLRRLSVCECVCTYECVRVCGYVCTWVCACVWEYIEGVSRGLEAGKARGKRD